MLAPDGPDESSALDRGRADAGPAPVPALADPLAFRARATEAPRVALLVLFFADAFLAAAFLAVALLVAFVAVALFAAALLAVAGAFWAVALLPVTGTVRADAGPAPVPALAEPLALRARAAGALAVAFLGVAFRAVADAPSAAKVLVFVAGAVECGEAEVLASARLDLDSAIASAAVTLVPLAEVGSSAVAVAAARVALAWSSDALVALAVSG